MKDILTNRTYQIVGGSALLVLLVFLFAFSGVSQEEAVTTQPADTTQTDQVTKPVEKTDNDDDGEATKQ